MITITLHLNVDTMEELIVCHLETAQHLAEIIEDDVCLFWEDKTIVEEEEQ